MEWLEATKVKELGIFFADLFGINPLRCSQKSIENMEKTSKLVHTR